MLARIRTGAGGKLAAAAVVGLHLLVAALLPLADADIEAAAAADIAVQLDAGRGDGSTPRSHDHFDCQFCRVLGQGAVAAAGTARTAVLDEPAAPAPPAADGSIAPAASPLPLGSRAPPLA